MSYKERRKTSYNTYLESYKNNDGTVNWLPACGEVDTIVANKALFEKYNISLPTDYGGFVQAYIAFDEQLKAGTKVREPVSYGGRRRCA